MGFGDIDMFILIRMSLTFITVRVYIICYIYIYKLLVGYRDVDMFILIRMLCLISLQ